ncbi:MAG: FAD-dependent oxidoreductase, partial [Ktedonobacteraceae bacterium]|nr:FAD-dependent oxidoreductase [Ktedonobacteraceae bacterium]
MQERQTDILIAGGGLGGVAAALAALRLGKRVILTEETDWLGGQLTAQAVPPDEHRWIEESGCTASYRRLREGIRAYYRRNYPLLPEARENPRLNPGMGGVSRLCHEPRIALAVLEEMLAPYRSGRQLEVLLKHRPVTAEYERDRVQALTIQSDETGEQVVIRAPYILDATEMGDVLPLAGVEHVIGAESQTQTGE